MLPLESYSTTATAGPDAGEEGDRNKAECKEESHLSVTAIEKARE